MWKHRTNVGRVVYDRKPHFFSCRDVRRILTKLSDQPADYLGMHYSCFVQTWKIAWDLAYRGGEYTELVDELFIESKRMLPWRNTG